MNNASHDEVLLREFVEGRSEDAFRQLVERYTGLVFGVALRCTGSHELSQEVSQNVFTIFAAKAARLSARDSLAPWLHRTAFFEATKLRRAETRRMTRMNKLVQDSMAGDDPHDPWEEVRPWLDEAIERLSEPDRRVLLMHYFDGLTFREIAGRLGSTAEAAQKRSIRALEKLSGHLKAKGTPISVSALATGMAGQLTQAAPAGLATLIAKGALAASGGGLASGAAAGSATSLFSPLTQIMTFAKSTTVAVALASASIPIGLQFISNQRAAALVPPAAGTVITSTNAVSPQSAVPARISAEPAPRVINGLDLDLLARQLARLPAPEDQPEIELQLRRLMLRLDLEQVRAVAGLLRAATNLDALSRVSAALFSRWAELNPIEAAAAALELPSRLKWMSLDAALLAWSGSDTDAALQWLAQAPDLPLRDVHQSVVFRQIALRGPRQAAERGLAMEDARLRRAGVLAALEVWAQTAPQDALAWAESREAEAQRNDYASQVINALTRRDPEKAVATAQAASNPHVRGDGTMYALLQWGQLDPAAAAAAFMQLPDPERRERTLEQLAGSVAGSGLDQARAFLARIPEGPHRLTALAGLFPVAAQKEPALAGDLVLPLATSAEHRLQFEGWVRRWAGQDPDAFQRWFNQLPDSAEKQAAGKVMAQARIRNTP